MFRDVPCSGFYRRPVGTYSRLLIHRVAGVKGVVVWGGGGGEGGVRKKRRREEKRRGKDWVERVQLWLQGMRMLTKKNIIEISEGWDWSITYFLKVKTCFPLKSLFFKLLKFVFFGVLPLWSYCEITLRVGWDVKIGIHLTVAIVGEFVRDNASLGKLRRDKEIWT